MPNPFKKISKTAQETQTQFQVQENSKNISIKCKNCGAARPTNTNLTTCDYCGHKFMDINTEIRIKKI
jgi:Zn finger protein HypA/HybF involved in hydrogenase expression